MCAAGGKFFLILAIETSRCFFSKFHEIILLVYKTTVRGKNKRGMTKFYNSNLYWRYEIYIWGESNLYRCALTTNILGLMEKVSLRYTTMIEISRVPKWGHFCGTAKFTKLRFGKSRFSFQRRVGRQNRQSQTNSR